VRCAPTAFPVIHFSYPHILKPTDYRNLTWREVLTHLTEDMVRVHLAWQAFGPGTTREVAQRSGISLLTLRPRTTDLGKLGLVTLAGGKGTEGGIYAYVPREEAEASAIWREQADFRGKEQGAEPTAKPVGFVTVEQAVASMAPEEQAQLGARLLGRYGHLLKKREAAAGARQLDLLPA